MRTFDEVLELSDKLDPYANLLKLPWFALSAEAKLQTPSVQCGISE